MIRMPTVPTPVLSARAVIALQPITRIAPFLAIVAFYVENLNRRFLNQTAMKWN
jgi:hypothetical protein